MILTRKGNLAEMQAESARQAEQVAALQTLVQATALTDEQAVSVAAFFPEWAAGTGYAKGDRVTHGGVLFTCLQAHESQVGWEPGAAPSLWAEVLAGQGGTEVGEWKQPESTNPYMKGDRVIHNGKTWECSIDNNVWEPGVYGWAEV